MNHSIYQRVEDFAVPLPITSSALAIARQFARQQPTPEKADRVRLNTLAVLVVNEYLQWLGIETDLEASDSWNPVVRMCADVADLELPNIGRLECRPIEGSGTECLIPQEVRESRIGYAIVQIDETIGQANLLGFTTTVDGEQLSIKNLQSPEDLIDRIATPLKQTSESAVEPRSTRVYLQQWFDEIFEAGWQAVETLLNPTDLTPAMSFRTTDLEVRDVESSSTISAICQAKLLHLNDTSAESLSERVFEFSVVLLVEIQRSENGTVDIVLQVHPRTPRFFLPPDLQLLILDEARNEFMEVRSRTADNYIQIQFGGEPGEKFSVKVALGNAIVTEEFEI
ncbi:MAG TPA: DUF1822 family protein [Oscillatoriales cyanobacterium M59_W2019_021]|nr:DUF1822 family protein [Oscillatoriales cyanobacterium M4454_W2019_049]HIK50757.1 DUF1822 family protein [Oscillatoriales cyanobacterium M59_W2019_021]